MADQFTWRGPSGGAWNTAANWINTTIGGPATQAPGFTDTANFFPGQYTVTGGGSASTVTLIDGAQPTLAGTGSEVYGFGRLSVGADTRLFVDNSVLVVSSTTVGQNGIVNLVNAPPGTGLARIPGSASLGDVTLAAPAPPTGSPFPAPGGVLNIGTHNITVGTVTNGNQGEGNAFNPRAGILGTGTLFQAPNSDHPMVKVLQDGQEVTSLDFGSVQVGDSAVLHFTLENFAGNGGGPAAQGALQTLVNGGNVTDPALSGSGVTAQNFTIGGRGGQVGYDIVLDTSQAHDLAGQALHIAFQFNNGRFDVGQTLAITGQVEAAAAPIDWNALAARVEAAFAATGTWYVPDEPPLTPPGQPVDWNALAAQVEANFAATGSWYL